MARAKKQQKVEAAEQEIVVVNEEILVAGEEAAVEDLGIGEVVETEAAAPVVTEETVSTEEAPLPEITQEDIRLVEAILFATSAAVSEGQIAERFPADRVAIIPQVLEHLKEQYANRGVNLVQRNARWAFRTATDLGDQLRLEKEQPKKFTRSAMETMAIIAYHQPVTRAEIENIRGVATAPGALDALMEAGWIKPGKRREVPGRPVTWLSTQGFLDHFGLEKLEDLPGMDELKAAGLLDKRPAIEAMPTADLFDEENKQEEDPQEVTDEDLVGKVTEEGGSIEDIEPTASASDDESDEDEDFDDEDDGDDDEDAEDAEDASDEDDDEESDDDDSDDDDDDDSDDDGDDDEEASDDDDDDDDDEDYDDEDDDSDDDDDDSDDEDDEDGEDKE
ncbi:MAG: SMC-Scp complex subunit ScpB [Alphaproteobacteria bacterium]